MKDMRTELSATLRSQTESFVGFAQDVDERREQAHDGV